MGNLREYILTPVKKELMKDLGSGEFGMVTNDSTIRVFNEAGTLANITGNLSITDKSDLDNSLIDLFYEWYATEEEGQPVKIGECLLSTTWVSIEKRGVVKVSKLPDYFYTFLNNHFKKEDRSFWRPIYFRQLSNN
ncbi:MAG: hypothetical protein HC906_05235 [Bacteroidales bacterium]|nr:hypothetical protein [Bacteroidales bacterium]